jgi:hypothetical protein
MTTITKESLLRYFETSTLTEDQKQQLLKEFEETKGSRDVLNKAVTLNNRKMQSKIVTTNQRK